MVYIVYIKHNNMEMKKKKKKKVLVLYPSGNYLYPTTGGELYDSYLFKRILFSGQIDMSFFTKIILDALISGCCLHTYSGRVGESVHTMLYS